MLVAGSVVLYAAVPWAPDDPLEVARRGVVVLTQASSLWAAGQSGSLWLPGLQPFGQTWSLVDTRPTVVVRNGDRDLRGIVQRLTAVGADHGSAS